MAQNQQIRQSVPASSLPSRSTPYRTISGLQCPFHQPQNRQILFSIRLEVLPDSRRSIPPPSSGNSFDILQINLFHSSSAFSPFDFESHGNDHVPHQIHKNQFRLSASQHFLCFAQFFLSGRSTMGLFSFPVLWVIHSQLWFCRLLVKGADLLLPY